MSEEVEAEERSEKDEVKQTTMRERLDSQEQHRVAGAASNIK